jgi:hypothetical protein
MRRLVVGDGLKARLKQELDKKSLNHSIAKSKNPVSLGLHLSPDRFCPGGVG